MPKIETVEVNGVIVNKGDEATAAKWAKNTKEVQEVEAEAEAAEPKKKTK